MGDQQATVREVTVETIIKHGSPYDPGPDDWERLADEWIAALDREGWAIVPKEPVAWRLRYLRRSDKAPITGWHYSDERPDHSLAPSYEIQPLAAITQPQGGE